MRARSGATPSPPARARPLAAAALLVAACATGRPPGAAQAPGALDVRVDLEEARAVIAYLEERSVGDAAAPEASPEGAWRTLRATRAYRRLGERQKAMGRPLSDSVFRAFLDSDSLRAELPALRASLERWAALDASKPAARALRYLPAGTTLRAEVFPVIKPASNSFVFDLSGEPAIFFAIDTERTAAYWDNTVAHELHHVGTSAACDDRAMAGVPSGLATVALWTGAFAEGLAVLAAAGGPEVHPHASGTDADRVRWDRDVARWADDLAELDSFFLSVLDGELGGDEVTPAAMRFFGEAQGPWYTVGWRMAAEVERRLGRDRLVASVCAPELLLLDYQTLAPEGADALPRWSDRLIVALSGLQRDAPR